MAQEGPNPGSPHDLVRVGITLTAIAIALAAFRPESALAPFFLLVGIAAVVGTGYAVFQLWDDCGLGARNLIPWPRPPHMDGRFEALVWLTWAKIGMLATYLALLFSIRY
jgi:hypothetical protein